MYKYINTHTHIYIYIYIYVYIYIFTQPAQLYSALTPQPRVSQRGGADGAAVQRLHRGSQRGALPACIRLVCPAVPDRIVAMQFLHSLTQQLVGCHAVQGLVVKAFGSLPADIAAQDAIIKKACPVHVAVPILSDPWSPCVCTFPSDPWGHFVSLNFLISYRSLLCTCYFVISNGSPFFILFTLGRYFCLSL